MWEPQILATLTASTVSTGITLPLPFYIRGYEERCVEKEDTNRKRRIERKEEQMQWLRTDEINDTGIYARISCSAV
jgi:hypothetical protein